SIQGVEGKDERTDTEKGSSSQEETQEEESVVFFKQQVDDLEKKVDALITQMQEDLEVLFSQLASQLVEGLQNHVVSITDQIEEMRYKVGQRNETAMNLNNAENAIQAFYHCLEGRSSEEEEQKESV
ncbi:hypothetical protein WA538_002612, partial [Blastocystis sp. DL]